MNCAHCFGEQKCPNTLDEPAEDLDQRKIRKLKQSEAAAAMVPKALTGSQCHAGLLPAVGYRLVTGSQCQTGTSGQDLVTHEDEYDNVQRTFAKYACHLM